MAKVCRVPDCGRRIQAKDICKPHQYRLKNYGDMYEFFPIKGQYKDYPEYVNYKSMIDRCRPSAHYSRNYYDKGVRICERWTMRLGFLNFLIDMGSKPGPEYTLDRIDSNGNYEPGNCRWATMETQNNNTSRNRRITVNGVTKTYSQWAKSLGVSRHTIRERFNRGWPVEKIVTTPASHGNKWLGLSK